MSNSTKSFVLAYPTLEYKRNQGEDRIRKTGVKGSLWIKSRFDGFRLQTTSEIADILDTEIERICGNSIGEHKGYNYWYIDDSHTVEKIIEFLAQS